MSSREDKFTLKDASQANGAELVGTVSGAHTRSGRFTASFSKSRANPAPHASKGRAGGQARPRREAGKLLFPAPAQLDGNNFPYTFMGFEPGTSKSDLRQCLERWNEGDNGILDLSKAYRLKPGTGWLIPPCVLHAPGSLVTYEPQWGSDVFGMYQSMVEGRRVPWELLIKDVPEQYHHDLNYLVDQLDWEKNVDPDFKKHNYLEPIIRSGGAVAQHVDKWIVYGRVDGKQFSAPASSPSSPAAR